MGSLEALSGEYGGEAAGEDRESLSEQKEPLREEPLDELKPLVRLAAVIIRSWPPDEGMLK